MADQADGDPPSNGLTGDTPSAVDQAPVCGTEVGASENVVVSNSVETSENVETAPVSQEAEHLEEPTTSTAQSEDIQEGARDTEAESESAEKVHESSEQVQKESSEQVQEESVEQAQEESSEQVQEEGSEQAQEESSEQAQEESVEQPHEEQGEVVAEENEAGEEAVEPQEEVEAETVTDEKVDEDAEAPAEEEAADAEAVDGEAEAVDGDVEAVDGDAEAVDGDAEAVDGEAEDEGDGEGDDEEEEEAEAPPEDDTADEIARMQKKYDIEVPVQETPPPSTNSFTAPPLKRAESVCDLLSKLQARKQQLLGTKAQVQVAKVSRFQLKTQELQQKVAEQAAPQRLAPRLCERSGSGLTIISLDPPKLTKADQVRRDLGLDVEPSKRQKTDVTVNTPTSSSRSLSSSSLSSSSSVLSSLGNKRSRTTETERSQSLVLDVSSPPAAKQPRRSLSETVASLSKYSKTSSPSKASTKASSKLDRHQPTLSQLLQKNAKPKSHTPKEPSELTTTTEEPPTETHEPDFIPTQPQDESSTPSPQPPSESPQADITVPDGQDAESASAQAEVPEHLTLKFEADEDDSLQEQVKAMSDEDCDDSEFADPYQTPALSATNSKTISSNSTSSPVTTASSSSITPSSVSSTPCSDSTISSSPRSATSLANTPIPATSPSNSSSSSSALPSASLTSLNPTESLSSSLDPSLSSSSSTTSQTEPTPLPSGTTNKKNLKKRKVSEGTMKLNGTKFFDTEASEDEAEGDANNEEEEEGEGDEIDEAEQAKLDEFIVDGLAKGEKEGHRPFNDESDDEELNSLVRRFVRPSQHAKTEEERDEEPEQQHEDEEEKAPEEEVLKVAGQIHEEKQQVVKIKQTKWQRDLVEKAQKSFTASFSAVAKKQNTHSDEEDIDEKEAEALAAKKKERAQLKLKIIEEQSVHSVQLDGSSREILSKIKKTNISRTLSGHSYHHSTLSLSACSSSASSSCPSASPTNASAGALNFAELNKELSIAKKPLFNRQSSFFSLNIDSSLPAKETKGAFAPKPVATPKTTKAVVFRTNSLGGHSLPGSDDSKSKGADDGKMNGSAGSADFSAFLRPNRSSSFSEKLMLGRTTSTPKFGLERASSGFLDKSNSLGSADLSRSLPKSLSDISRSLGASLSNERSRGSLSEVPALPKSSRPNSASTKKNSLPTALKGMLAFKNNVKPKK